MAIDSTQAASVQNAGAKVKTVDGQVTQATPASSVVRNITLSTSQPSGGNDGDVWFVYV